jgi:hypothetical protein
LEGASFGSSDAGGSSQHTWAFLASDWGSPAQYWLHYYCSVSLLLRFVETTLGSCSNHVRTLLHSFVLLACRRDQTDCLT